MNADELGELLRVLGDSDVEELELEQDGARLLIRRDPTVGIEAWGLGVGEASPISEPPTASPQSWVVTSPSVGVFRRSAGGPSEPPVHEGDSVTAGQVVGAVEAMRVLNRVQSEQGGVVEQLLVQDGQPVEYGQPLLVIRR